MSGREALPTSEALPAMTTMATMKFEHFMGGKCEYLRCFLASGGVCEGSEAHLSLSRKVLAVAATQLEFVASLNTTTATRIVDIVMSSNLTPDDKNDLLNRLNDKVDLEESVDNHNSGVRAPSSGTGGPSSGSGGFVPVEHTTLAATVKKWEERRRSQIHPQLWLREVVGCYV